MATRRTLSDAQKLILSNAATHPEHGIFPLPAGFHALGGLRPAARRKLVAWSGSLADSEGRQSQSSAPAAAVRLKPGATLIRTWHGTTHTVQVGENGFEHHGFRYTSLFHIAQVITGTHWSGPRFFGLSGTPRSPTNAAARGEDDADAAIV